LMYAFLGDNERSLATIHSVAEYTTLYTAMDLSLGIMAQIYLMQGLVEEAEKTIARKVDLPAQKQWPLFFVYLAIAECQLSLAQKKYEQALMQTTALLIDLRHYGIKAYIPAALHLQGFAHLGLGNLEMAYQQWQAALAGAMTIGGRWMQWQILATLSEYTDDTAEKQRLRTEAQALIAYIAERTPPDLREMFLKRPFVRAVFD